MAAKRGKIEYRHNVPLDPQEVAKVFDAAGIIRPTSDLPRIARMYAHANLVISAWDKQQLIGVARCLCDFSHCCYLADLAVHRDYQKQGIGRELLRAVQGLIGDEVSLILLSAPGAMEFYPKVGFMAANNAFVIKRKR